MRIFRRIPQTAQQSGLSRWVLRALGVLFIGLTGCVTSGSNSFLRDDYESEDLSQWVKDSNRDRARLDTELRQVRLGTLGNMTGPRPLWKVSNGKTSLFMLGSTHRHISWDSFPVNLRRCLTEASSVGFEISFEGDESTRAFSTVAKQNIEAAGHSADLSKLLGPAAWDRLRRDLAIIKPEALEVLTPHEAVNLYLTIRLAILNKDEKCLDCEIYREAAQLKKKFFFLENAADRLPTAKLFLGSSANETPEEARKFFLTDPFNAVKEIIQREYEVASMYRQGNLPALEKLMSADRSTYDILISQRNKAWLPRIIAATQTGGGFLVVGVGHMTGGSSLLKILKGKGLAVEQVDTCER